MNIIIILASYLSLFFFSLIRFSVKGAVPGRELTLPIGAILRDLLRKKIMTYIIYVLIYL